MILQLQVVGNDQLFATEPQGPRLILQRNPRQMQPLLPLHLPAGDLAAAEVTPQGNARKLTMEKIPQTPVSSTTG